MHGQLSLHSLGASTHHEQVLVVKSASGYIRVRLRSDYRLAVQLSALDSIRVTSRALAVNRPTRLELQKRALDEVDALTCEKWTIALPLMHSSYLDVTKLQYMKS